MYPMLISIDACGSSYKLIKESHIQQFSHCSSIQCCQLVTFEALRVYVRELHSVNIFDLLMVKSQ